MIVLVLNCGSSSLKYQVLDMQGDANDSMLAKGLVERIGLENGDITHKPEGKGKYKISMPIPDHTVGIKSVLDLLVDPEWGVLESLNQIEAVGHRVAHGGETYPNSCLIDSEVVAGIEEICVLAPLHNPANILGIRAIENLMPSVPQVAVFDTSFHQTMPARAYTYPIPYEYYDKYKVRRYGFHGTSHKFVAQKGCELTGLDFENSKIITCHLGNGGSVTAINNGKSVDTSMGFTPMEGVVMGTRCGSIDVGIMNFIQEKENIDYKELNSILNKKSGFLGMSNVSSDCRDVEIAAEKGDAHAALALEVFQYSVLKYIGAYTAVLGGVDLIIFTGGIGENDSNSRKEICNNLGYLGVEFNQEANDGVRGKDVLISKPESKVKVMTLTTNEELVIARETMNIVK